MRRHASTLVTLTKSQAHPRVAVITLNDPARLNALTERLGDAWGAVLGDLNVKDFSAVVVTGAGRAFSAGGDLDFLRARALASPGVNAVTMRAFYTRFLSPMRACPLPIVAAVSGPAIGAGAALATAADVRVVSPGSKIGFTFTHLGIHCGMGSSHFLPRVVGVGAAARLLLTGEVVSGVEAAAMGWGVLAGQEEGAALVQAIDIAAKMAAGAPAAVRGITRTLRAAGDVGLSAALEREAAEQAYCYATADFAKGVEAVANKKPATWDWAAAF